MRTFTSVPARARRWRSTGPPRRWPCWRTATTWSPTTSSAWPSRCWPIASWRRAIARAAAPTLPRRSWATSSVTGPCRCEGRGLVYVSRLQGRTHVTRGPGAASAKRKPGLEGDMRTAWATSRQWIVRHLPVAGRYWALATLLLLLFGISKNINLLTLLGWLMLAVLAGNALVAGRKLGRLLGWQRISGPVFAGQPVRLEVTVANPRRRTQQGLLLESDSPLGRRQWFVPQLAGQDSYRFRDEIVLPRR